MKLTKINLAKLVIANSNLDISESNLVKLMFRNFVKDDARFQLTYKGFQFLKHAGIKAYKIKIKSKLSIKAIINIDRACPCPYYISPKTMYVVMFAQKPAVILQMLDGDAEQFNM
tara:strand:+ start:1910 stop:2254 length:345 start_codon:yes stop_codon:yes gene_type:complete